MVFDLNNLPSDIPVLHKMLAALNNNIQSLITENQSLREQLALIKAKRYGKSSEKLDKQIEEIELKIEENELILGFKTERDNVNSDKSIATVDDSKQKPKRQKLPEHLPREAVVLKPVDQCKVVPFV
ncbi:transposase domain-containing protein [Candidatus Tisiphia endosymbiont of Ceraclea dissimilis]|uniref:transposase domain-containing protein n=1 Tax=Candidatus Tisiphia endosymbiont of Ceraclea dissimilis TaxID=3077928 RepID=UPI003CCB5B15